MLKSVEAQSGFDCGLGIKVAKLVYKVIQNMCTCSVIQAEEDSKNNKFKTI